MPSGYGNLTLALVNDVVVARFLRTLQDAVVERSRQDRLLRAEGWAHGRLGRACRSAVHAAGSCAGAVRPDRSGFSTDAILLGTVRAGLRCCGSAFHESMRTAQSVDLWCYATVLARRRRAAPDHFKIA